MTYYIFIKNNEIIGKGFCKCLNKEVSNIETTEDVYNDIEKYIFKDNEFVLNPDYEKELKKKERERLDSLSLTAADVERAIYKAKGMDFDDLLNFVSANPPEGLDIKALKIELKANNFYRGNPYINAVGAILGFTPDMLDKFFETNDYTKLMTPTEEDTSEDTDKGAENAPPDIAEDDIAAAPVKKSIRKNKANIEGSEIV